MYKNIIILMLLCLSIFSQQAFAQNIDLSNLNLTSKQIKDYEKKAKKGDYQAQLCIGYSYLKGINVQKNINAGISYLKKACELGAENGDAYPIVVYTYLLMSREIIISNADKEIDYWARIGAFDMNNMSCMALFGTYKIQKAQVKDGIEYLVQAAESGEISAMLILADLYTKSVPPTYSPNYDEAFKWASMASEKGLVQATRILVELYSKGLGTTKNLGLAIEYGKKSLEGGISCDDLLLDECLNSSDANHNIEGFKILEAHKGDKNPDMWRMLARCYEDGKGTSQDYEKAIQWYELAEMAGDERSAVRLATANLYGNLGLNKDENSALSKLQSLSDSGNDYALLELTKWYFSKSDGESALKYLNKAKDLLETRGSKVFSRAQVMENMAIVYTNNNLGVKDIEKAKECYQQITLSDGRDIYHLIQGTLCYNKEYDMLDYKMAKFHFNKVIELSSDPRNLYVACRNLSSIYRYGRGVEIDEEKADELLKKAETYDQDLIYVGEYRRISDMINDLNKM